MRPLSTVCSVSLPGRDLSETSLLCVLLGDRLLGPGSHRLVGAMLERHFGLSELVAEELVEGFGVLVHSLVRR